MSGRVGMGKRIAHPDRDACRAALDRFFAALHAALVAAASSAREPGAARALDDFARRVSTIATSTRRGAPDPGVRGEGDPAARSEGHPAARGEGDPAARGESERIPVCRFWDAALADM